MEIRWKYWSFTISTTFSTEEANAVPNSKIGDGSLFVITCNPLRLTSTGIIFWNNLSSQYERMCRSISIKCAKEISDLIMEQKGVIENENLKCIEIKVGEICLRIHFTLRLTSIDGKVLDTITDTKSMQTCPICHATPTQFNDLTNKDKGIFLANQQSLQFGISLLHAWIRLLELCLNLSYRINVQKWHMRSLTDKTEYARQKAKI